jgi:hypothetical protein
VCSVFLNLSATPNQTNLTEAKRNKDTDTRRKRENETKRKRAMPKLVFLCFILVFSFDVSFVLL